MYLTASGWFKGWKQLGCAIQVTYQRLYFEWFDFTVFYTNTGNTWICIANVLVSPLHVTSAESSIGNPLCAWAGTRQLCPSISYRVWDNSVVQIMQHSSAFHYHPLFIDAQKTFPRNPDSGPTLLAIEDNITSEDISYSYGPGSDLTSMRTPLCVKSCPLRILVRFCAFFSPVFGIWKSFRASVAM